MVLNSHSMFKLQNCGRKTVTEIINYQNKIAYLIERNEYQNDTQNLKSENFLVELSEIDKFMFFNSKFKLHNRERKTVNEISSYKQKTTDLIGNNEGQNDTQILKNIKLSTDLFENDELIDFDTHYYSVEKWVSKICKNSPRKKQIFMLRMGMRGNAPMTLEQTGAKFDITRERVREILVGIEKTARHHIHQQTVSPLINRILGIVKARGGKITDATLLYLLFEKNTDGEMMRFASPIY